MNDLPDNVDLQWIGRTLLAMQRDLRTLSGDVRSLQTVHDEVRLLREEVRIARSSLARIEDTVTMDVLDRLRALEVGR